MGTGHSAKGGGGGAAAAGPGLLSNGHTHASPTLSPELLRVLRYLGTLLDAYNQPFEARRLGFAIMGLSGLPGGQSDVLALVGQLAARAEGAWGDLSSQELSMCLHGLTGLTSDTPNVRRLVAALVPLFDRCPRMSQSDIRSAMFGLQGLYSSSKEVNDLVAALAALLVRSEAKFATSYDMSTALHSMQGLSSNQPSTRNLQACVARALVGVAGRCEGRDVSMSVYGLREQSSAHEETLAVVARLTAHFHANFDGSLSAQNVAATLQGMQKLRSGVKEVDELVAVLAPLVGAAHGTFNPKGLSMALNGLQVRYSHARSRCFARI